MSIEGIASWFLGRSIGGHFCEHLHKLSTFKLTVVSSKTKF